MESLRGRQDYLAKVKSTHESGECATGGPQASSSPCPSPLEPPTALASPTSLWHYLLSTPSFPPSLARGLGCSVLCLDGGLDEPVRAQYRTNLGVVVFRWKLLLLWVPKNFVLGYGGVRQGTEVLV